MSRCEYSYYVIMLPCNQFYRGRQGEGRDLTRGRGPSGAPP